MRLDAIEIRDDGSLLIRTPPDPRTGETDRRLDVLDWVHAVTGQIPDRGHHLVRYFGAYACRNHIAPRPRPPAELTVARTDGESNAASTDAPRASPARRASWARLIRRVFEVDPLLCRCGATMAVVSVITDPEVVERILRHLRAKGVAEDAEPRAPPP